MSIIDRKTAAAALMLQEMKYAVSRRRIATGPGEFPYNHSIKKATLASPKF